MRLVLQAGLLLLAGVAQAQTTPNWPYGYVPPAQEWSDLWASKCDLDATGCTVTPQGGTQGTLGSLLGSLATGKQDAGLTTTLTKTVCPSGCDYPDPLTGFNALKANPVVGPAANITLQVSDGTYSLTGSFFTDQPGTAAIHIRGNCTTPGAVTLSFTNIVGNNGSGFVAQQGGRIGGPGGPGVDCLTISGVGARQDRTTWASQSYGAGAFALGTGSNITFGSKVVVQNFYYGVLADQGGRFVGDGGTFRNAGDSNLLARFGGVIQCLGCTLTTAAHLFTDAYGNAEVLGHNALAEGAASLYVDGSVASDAQIACVASHTSAAVWAHQFTGTGCVTYGASADQGGMMELGHSHFSASGVGVHAGTGGILNVDSVESNGNTYDGMLLDGGRASGGAFNSHNNGGFGLNIIKQGRGELYGTAALLLSNTSGAYYVEGESGCTATFTICNPGSTLIMDGVTAPGWVVYNQTVTASGGSGLVATASLHGLRRNTTSFTFTGAVMVSTVGGSGSLSIAMPFTAVSGCVAVGKETGANGYALLGQWIGTNLFLSTYNNLYPIVAGTTSLTISGTCEVSPF